MNTILSDANTYKLLNKDPTKSFEKISNTHIKELLKLNIIDSEQCYKFLSSNSITPRIYGLVKIHKPDYNICPIVSYVGSPLYKLSSVCAGFLNSVLTESKFAVKNSYDFVNKVKNINIPDNYRLVSLDVQSLFTNITSSLIEKALIDCIQTAPAHTISVINDFILPIIKFIMNSTYFTYCDKLYTQTRVCSMGSPISPILAHICMEFVIDQACKNLHFDIPFLVIFVDDILMAVPECEVTNTLQVFNSIDSNIVFTHEIEYDESITYLDTLIIRSQNALLTRWHRKSWASNRMLHFKSFHCMSHKMASLLSLKHRIFTLSHLNFTTDNLKIFFAIAMNSGYPNGLINRCLNTRSKNDATYCPTQIVSDLITIPTRKFYKFPFLRGLSNKIKMILKKEGIDLALYTVNNLYSLYSNLKQKIDRNDVSQIVYKIPCSDCNKCYIGTTKNKLQARIKQHQYDCRQANSHKLNRTALAYHHFNEGHTFEFGDTKILDIETNYRKRLISEMLHIKRTPLCVNFKTDTKDLSIIYTGLFHL